MQKMFSFMLLFVFATVAGFSQEKGKMKSPKATTENDNIKIVYSQPSKHDREIFGGLVPYGKVWRTGANEATEITFKKQCNFGGKTIQPGTYSLFTIPEQNEWTVIINSQMKQWGSFEYEKYIDKDVARVKVPVKHLDNAVETFAISLSRNGLDMEWDKTLVTVPMKF